MGETEMRRYANRLITRGFMGWGEGRPVASRHRATRQAPRCHPQADRLSGGETSVASEPTIRHELVARVRREIAAGTYDTPEKFDIAMERLLARLERE